jgi:hypothetical protein
MSKLSSAGDAKMSPATVCQVIADGGGGARYLSNGTFQNVGSDFILLDCPILRDVTGPGTVAGGFAWVINRGPAANSVSCQLVAQTATDATFGVNATSSLISSSAQKIVFGSFTAPDESREHMVCLLPPGAEMKAFFWVEP